MSLGDPEPAAAPERIVSMAPSLTETLFALGAGERVVGVTSFCDYPEEAASRTRVGGFFDPNYEVIVSLRPDLAVLLASQEEVKMRLEALGVRTLSVNHEQVTAIVDSITSIGQAVGCADKAREIVESMERRIERVRKKVEGLDRPTVLVSIGRNMGSEKLEEAYIAGPNSLYNDLLELAGGRNVCKTSGILYPSVSYEGILDLNPETIIDLVGDLSKTGQTRAQVEAQWMELRHVAAVENRRVYVVEDTYALRPGPRLVLTIETVARLLHPNAEWETP
ncbi:ABC transporter substrate-binding protein [Candidatus Sumerlaeota bacterium]|nr:ABC transporter substrate-binding protein [Candidatus Sumerlaeota bacterium]